MITIIQFIDIIKANAGYRNPETLYFLYREAVVSVKAQRKPDGAVKLLLLTLLLNAV